MPHGFDIIKKDGYWWKAIYDLLVAYCAAVDGFLAKLDADTGDTAWATTYAWVVTIGTTYGKDLGPTHSPQGKLVQLLEEMRENHNSVIDAMAADDGVAGTTVFTNEKFSSTEFIVDEANARMKDLGVWWDEIALFLNDLIPHFNRILAYCDVDGDLTDTDYASLWAIGEFVWPSSSSSSCSSSCSSSSSSFSSSSSSSSRSSSSSSSSKSSSSSSSRSSSSSSSSRSSSSSSSSSSSKSSSSSSSSSSSKSSSSSSSSSSSKSSSSSSSCSSSSSSSSRSSTSSSSSSSSSSQSVG